MNKLQSVLLGMIVIVLLFMSNLYEVKIHFNALFYQNKTYLTMDYKDGSNFNQTLQEWKEFSKKHKIILGSVTINNENNIVFYQTSMQSDYKKFLSSGKLPVKKSEYLANYQEKNNPRQVGTIAIPNKMMKISVHNIDVIKNNGLSSSIFIEGNGKEIQKAKQFLAKYGTVEENSNFNPVGSFLSQFIISGIFLLVLIILYIFFLFFKAERKTKEMAILNILGKSKKEIHMRIIRKDICVFLTLLCGTLFGAILLSILANWYIYTTSYFITLLVSCVVYIVFQLIYAGIITVKTRDVANVIHQVKGSEFIKRLNLLNYIALVALTVILFSIFGTVWQSIGDLKKEEAVYSTWYKAKNVYKVAYNDNLGPGDVEKAHKINVNMVKLYKKLIADNKGFLQDTTNFSLISDYPYKFAFEENIHQEADVYGMAGNSILVSANYFDFNPIHPKKARKKLITDKNTLNIFVPKKLKPKAALIYHKMLDDFYDQSVDWKNTISKELGKSPIKMDKKKLKVNMIYIDNGQKHFTYSTYEGIPDKHYQITDPIIVVINPNIAEELISGSMTSSLYIKDKSHADAFTHIQPILRATHTQKNIVFVDSVFNQFGDKLNYIKSTLKINSMILMGIIVVLFGVLILQISIHYKINYQRLQIQILIGETSTSINKYLLLFIIGINMITLLGFTIFFKQILLLLVGVVLTLLETLLIMGYTYLLSRQSLSQLKKGGN